MKPVIKEVREKLIAICMQQYKDDYNLTNQDIADMFTLGITKEGVRLIDIRINQERVNKLIGKGK